MATSLDSNCTEHIHAWDSPANRISSTKRLKLSRLPDTTPYARPWTSPLLNLPMEIKQKIYDSVFTDWSLAIFDWPGIHQEHQFQQRNQQRDDTIMLRHVGSKMLSGPPGCDLMLACRDIYYSVRDRYGRGFTGRLYVGNVKRRLHSTLGRYMLRLSRLRRWYRRVISLSVSFNIEITKLSFQIAKLLPRLQFVDVLMYSTNHDLLDRPASRVSDPILRGRYDLDIMGKGDNAIRSFFGQSTTWEPLNLQTHYDIPVLSSTASIDIRLVHCQWHEIENTLGFHYRWQDGGHTVVNRVVRSPETLRYCGEGMGSGVFAHVITEDLDESDIPEHFRWVRIEVDEFLIS